ncbi:hypothetical protein NXV51_11585 [Bacteroides uniformis]|nr:hypothetical protein [Bacteroides uniformis]
MDETQWYNAEHGNGKAAQGRLYKYAIWNNTFGLTSTLNYNFNIRKTITSRYWLVMKSIIKSTSALMHKEQEFPIGGLTELNVAATPQK